LLTEAFFLRASRKTTLRWLVRSLGLVEGFYCLGLFEEFLSPQTESLSFLFPSFFSKKLDPYFANYFLKLIAIRFPRVLMPLAFFIAILVFFSL
jgi:hypothetical protein